MNDHSSSDAKQQAPAAFASALFSRAAAEDIRRYSPDEMAYLAAAAWSRFAAGRAPGACAIHLFDPPAGKKNLRQATLLLVVNDDMPFLLDSTLAELADRGLDLGLVAHPIFGVERDSSGRLVKFYPDPASAPTTARHESFIQIHVRRLSGEAQRQALVDALGRIYADVRAAAADRDAMEKLLAASIAAMRASPARRPGADLNETIEFLKWLSNDNFILLGMRSFRLSNAPRAGSVALTTDAKDGLGILRDPSVYVLRDKREFVAVTPEVIDFLQHDELLLIAKANVKSRVHRHVQMDYVGVKQFDRNGALSGELRILGLFSTSSYATPARNVPFVRRKIAAVMEASLLDPGSHSGRMLAETLESYPRDELFQIAVPTLAQFAAEIAALQERPRLRILTRADLYGRFVSILAYLPRDRSDTKVQARIGRELARIYAGRLSAVYPTYLEGPLVRVHYIVGRDEGATPSPSRDEVESAIARVVRTWSDRLSEAFVDAYGEAGFERATKWASAFSAGYMESFDVSEALDHIACIERLSDANPHAVVLHRRERAADRVDLEVFSLGRQMPLSDRVPVLESMGYRVISERTFEIAEAGGAVRVWLHDMSLTTADGEPVDFDERRALIEAGVAAVFKGRAENDGYNALIPKIGLNWREVALLRALSRFIRQCGGGWSQNFMARAATRNASIMGRVAALFAVRFDPALQLTEWERAARETSLAQEIDSLIRNVASLDEDRVLRRFVNLVQSATRTNYFQSVACDPDSSAIAVKFDSRKIEALPLPRPMFEVMVYSPRVEGVHLRFGRVARGGIRWSDRMQDFRTEILGLVKAQQVKNAVIVPVGAKGGFVPKQLPPAAQREAWLAEGTAAYRIFIGALLDVTDNLVANKVVPPDDVVRYDGDDPYLVVAADKGTATFSDIANRIAHDRAYWLDDAFASGGSAGYDHKKMGITARGAWVSVKRHFRELDIDIEGAPFTVAGVGDMSGDVFGNGMLRSNKMALVAAFDHRDIFIDPVPDPERSFVERARLFALARSSWQDYDRRSLSPGGGVFSRSSKTIALSPQVQRLLEIGRSEAAPDDVICAILRLNVDLLWFGGIGSYVRASDESDAEVGDRANDSIRIDATALRCKTIAEGANLALTQRARIQAALRGIRLNTDAIDNSAGVNTSDIEVNIKIALAKPTPDERGDAKSRDELLAELTDDIAQLVLENTYRQTLAISLIERQGAGAIDFASRLMQRLESDGQLDRRVEFLPSDDDLRARADAGVGLTRPEIAVLLAYSKLALHHDLLAGDAPDDPYFKFLLFGYFPKHLSKLRPDAIAAHRLRREIIATQLANIVIDFGGPSLIVKIADETGAQPATIARAFALAHDVFAAESIYAEIGALDGRVRGAAQLDLYAVVQELLLSRAQWFVRRVDLDRELDGLATKFRSRINEFATHLDDVVSPRAADSMARRAAEYVEQGVPESLAGRVARLGALSAACDIAVMTDSANRPMQDVAAAYFDVDEFFGIGALLETASRIATPGFYERLARDKAIEGIEQSRRRLTAIVVGASPGERQSASAWLARRVPGGDRILKTLRDLLQTEPTLAKAVVAASALDELAGLD